MVQYPVMGCPFWFTESTVRLGGCAVDVAVDVDVIVDVCTEVAVTVIVIGGEVMVVV
jgi:hypothetical protein